MTREGHVLFFILNTLLGCEQLVEIHQDVHFRFTGGQIL